jgi:hypothetical protein
MTQSNKIEWKIISWNNNSTWLSNNYICDPKKAPPFGHKEVLRGTITTTHEHSELTRVEILSLKWKDHSSLPNHSSHTSITPPSLLHLSSINPLSLLYQNSITPSLLQHFKDSQKSISSNFKKCVIMRVYVYVRKVDACNQIPKPTCHTLTLFIHMWIIAIVKMNLLNHVVQYLALERKQVFVQFHNTMCSQVY